MRKLILLVVSASLLAAWYWHSHHAAHAPRPADGELVITPPVWSALPFNHGDFIAYEGNEVQPLSSADLMGRVLAITQYPRSGFGQVSHTDLVLGWGPMSDNRVLDHLKITQADRGMDIVPDSAAPITLAAADDASISLAVYSDDFANSAALDAIRVGDVVRIVGWRMRARNASGATWEGGSGHERKGQSSALILVLKLQVNDDRKFGNWTAPAGS
jgi:hypothetical protein